MTDIERMRTVLRQGAFVLVGVGVIVSSATAARAMTDGWDWVRGTLLVTQLGGSAWIFWVAHSLRRPKQSEPPCDPFPAIPIAPIVPAVPAPKKRRPANGRSKTARPRKSRTRA